MPYVFIKKIRENLSYTNQSTTFLKDILVAVKFLIVIFHISFFSCDIV